MQRPREAHAQTATPAAGEAEPELVLVNLRKAKPRLEQAVVDVAGNRFIAQEAQIFDDIVVECLVFRLLAREQKEGIDEKRQVHHAGHIECSVVRERLRRDGKKLGEVDPDVGSLATGRRFHRRRSGSGGIRTGKVNTLTFTPPLTCGRAAE